MLKNRNILIIAFIAIVGAIGYGIVFPILYTYSQRFGLSDFDNGLLFAMFSICQFFSTPLIGRMSDKYGRRPLLIISLIGTAVSFFMMAFAQNAFWLFAARALDGITAGNFSVASAVISDSTTGEERARGFGFIMAAFNFGFVFGPAIAGLTVGLKPEYPFIIAGIITVISVILTFFFLPETNVHVGQVQKGKLFDFGALYHVLFDKKVNIPLIISLVYFFAFFLFVYAYSPFCVKVLHLSPTEIAMSFVLFGLVGLLAQTFLIGRVVKWFGVKRVLMYGLIGTTIAFLLLFLTTSVVFFVLVSILLSFANAFVPPVIQTILSDETDEKSQGSIMGINSSYQSLGQIAGPIVGGAIAMAGVPYPFLAGGVIAFVCYFLSFNVIVKPTHKESAF
jgi:multidrug resistance protein